MIIASKAAISTTAGQPYLWIIAGATGDLKTSDSTTASSFTSRTSSFGATQISGVASNGSGLYVAVGYVGQLATSTDGITWTQQTSSFGATDIFGIAYGSDGYWVAVGASGKVATSTDGITWTQRTTGFGGVSVNAIAYGNGLWVAGGNNSMRTATDPTGTWTSRTSTLAGLTQNGIYYAPDQGVWVAGSDAGTTGALASSTDGLTWTARTSSFTAASLGNAFTSTASVIINGNFTVLSPNACDVQTSTNGTTWTNRTPAVSATGILSGAVDDAGFTIMVNTQVQSTSDGITWTDRGATGMTGVWACCHSAGLPAIR